MSGYRLKVPHLILIESISFALFVIDFNGPAVASTTRDAVSVPVQFVGDAEHGRIRKVCLLVVHDEALLPKVMETMGVAITGVDLLLTFVGDRHFLKDRWMTLLQGVTMLRLQFAIKGI